MKTQATHTGTCQICGRRHKVDAATGAIAKHGYTVDFHYFNGTCGGADFPSYELSADRIPAIIKALAGMLNAERAHLTALQNGEVVEVVRMVRGENFVPGTRRREQVAVTFTPNSTDREISQHGWFGGWAEVMKSEIHKAARAVEGLSAELARFEARLAGWKLAPEALVAVPAESDRKVIAAGSRVVIGGKTYTVKSVEDRQVWGCGPHLNGKVMPHAVFDRASGKEYAYPVRLIRQTAILD